MSAITGYIFSPNVDDSVVCGNPANAEPCSVSFFDRAVLHGKLIGFFPDQRTATVRENHSDTVTTFTFDEIRSVLLTLPVNVKRSAERFGRQGITVHAIDRPAPFKIVYRDGLEFSGNLYAYGAGQQGFGVYLVVDGVSKEPTGIRCYFPASGISTFKVGEKLGVLLLKRGDLTEAGLQAALDRQRELRELEIGGLLVEQRLVNAEELDKALRDQSAKPIKKLGEVLVRSGIITDAQLSKALEEQVRRRNLPLGEILIEMGLIGKEVVREVLAQKLGIPYVDLARFAIETKAFRSIPTLLMLQNSAIPLYWSGHDLVVAMKDPLDVRAIDALRFAAHAKIIPVLATKDDIAQALRRRPQDDYALWSHEGAPARVINVAGKGSDAPIAQQSPFSSTGELGLQLEPMTDTKSPIRKG